jgi:hypothetical protein
MPCLQHSHFVAHSERVVGLHDKLYILCSCSALLVACCLYVGSARIMYIWYVHSALAGKSPNIRRVGQNRIYAPYMTVYLVISLPKTPYIHRICMVLANPKHIRYIRSCMVRTFGSGRP